MLGKNSANVFPVWKGKKKRKQQNQIKPPKARIILKSHRCQPERAPNEQTKIFSATKEIIIVLNFNPKKKIHIHESILV